jgi:alpha-beta hydrolase superfamily lysophospholipase
MPTPQCCAILYVVPEQGETPTESGATRSPLRQHPVIGGLLIGLSVVILIVGMVLFTPLFDRPVGVNAAPATTYEQAMVDAEKLLAADDAQVNPRCRSRVIDQGRRSAEAVVLLHGFTNCPAQFDALAQAYADSGYSVVVPRLPGHGLSDRLTDAPSDVHAPDIADTGNLAVDIASGLGEEVHAVGLSGGGTLAGWLASRRQEITQATLIAPLVIPKVLPEFAVAPVARLSRLIPDVYLWWDPEQKERLDDPPYAYPRYSIRSLGAFLTLGRSTLTQDRATPLDRLVVITNENDAAVSNAGVAEVADHLAESSEQREDKVFGARDGYGHDLIDPQGENADNLDEIYPQLAELLELPGLTAPAQ